MDENLSRGYVQLSKARGMNEFKFNNDFAHITPPVDRYNFIYFSLVLAGVGFLLPYNSFVIAVDYFQARYPGTTVIFDMSIVYITMAFVSVCANNILIETVSLNTRITFGYLVSVVTLNFVVVSEIWWEFFGMATSYTINLIAVAVVSVGCTIQQSSFYGYTSMLPSRYTQAVMAGESAAGFWVSISRILTKSLVADERGNTSMFFALSIISICLCSVLHRIVRKTEFVQFYITMCQEKNKITLEPTEDVGLMDPLDQTSNIDGQNNKGQYGILKLQTSPLQDSSSSTAAAATTTTNDSAFSFSNPVYEPNGPSICVDTTAAAAAAGPTYKVEDVVIIRGSYGSQGNVNKPWSGIKKGLMARAEVAKLIFPYMASIGVAYFVTLCLYPGIVSEIISCKFKSWMPVILMATFNGADLLGKILASIPYEWTRGQLVYFSIARIILIPLFLLCAIPRRAPVLSGESYPLLLSWLLGLTNGIVGSVPMIQAPSKVPEQHRELAGNIMTLSYTTGLTIGSLLAYILDDSLTDNLGRPITIRQVCPRIPRTFKNIFTNITTTTIKTSTTTTTPRSLTTLFANATLSTFKSINKIPILKTTTTTTATTAMTTIALTTTAVISNTTVAGIFDAASNSSTTTTMMTDVVANITSSISNSILPH
ncbi:hypothetical protein HCN44_002219 [Aphidius gifuensis]|uniref:Equilibrative nucleoside transporter n=1 Tax=Aphidius gifuensis TaxID=684658 RepID=A0A835CWP1_APHGI|nr:equilibrative nucleoside transporter 4 [Aphidius gifuensis]KAF7996573.1 hypothetical protein HCN44_002219 [Aphidius gifuensis]